MPHNDENEKPQSIGVNRRQFITRTAAGAAGAVALTSVLDACGGSSASSTTLAATDAQNPASGAWKFAVMADTQWVGIPDPTVGPVGGAPANAPDDGRNPNSSAVHIANRSTSNSSATSGF